jgi:hypothetical protein
VKLDRTRTFAEVHGGSGHHFEQDGKLFNQAGELVEVQEAPIEAAQETTTPPPYDTRVLLADFETYAKLALENLASDAALLIEETKTSFQEKLDALNGVLERSSILLGQLEERGKALLYDPISKETDQVTLFDAGKPEGKGKGTK